MSTEGPGDMRKSYRRVRLRTIVKGKEFALSTAVVRPRMSVQS